MRVAGLFAGVGGLERGLALAGLETALFCENDLSAQTVLRDRFPDVPLHDDVRTLAALPAGVDLITAGFPCQDLSQAGKTRGIEGARSGLVGEVFRLLEKHHTPWVLLENVAFMLQLARGEAMRVIVDAFEHLGYRWAYRVVDSRCSGVPQRRRRVYFLASNVGDPRTVLFADEAGEPSSSVPHSTVACGFYWTEGVRGLGWAVDAVPTLKGGSTVGIPSSPAILLPSGEVVQPDIRDAERLQGFPADWTKAAETAGKRSFRWKLVGNAVTVPVAAWIGRRLTKPDRVLDFATRPLDETGSWPTAAWNVGDGRVAVEASEWPVRRKGAGLTTFLRYPTTPLSAKATAGFLNRANQGSLRFPAGFLEALERHLAKVSGGTVSVPRRRVIVQRAFAF